MLKTHHLTTGYTVSRKAPFMVSENLNLTLMAGEMICLIGPNGAGKSTLMQTLAGMLKPLSGHVLLHEQDVHTMNPLELAKHLSIVLTDRPHMGMMTGTALVALGRHPYTDWLGQLTADDQKIVQWAIEVVSAQAFAEKPVNELSDGQRQKIMIARALAQSPDVMLLDEPTAFLDLPRRVEVMRLLKNLAREKHCAILLSTHDLDLALRTADRLWLMAATGEMQVGAPEDLALNGAFERVFHGEGVEFDPYSGSFKVWSGQRGTVALAGEGLAYLWTQRAMEREGFRIEPDAETQVHVENGRWRVEAGGKTAEYKTIYDLVQRLNGRA
jgi:iron complex transport system ATP-binding protein